MFRDVAAEKEWVTFTRFDNEGRTVLTAQPSAVSGYDEDKPDLMNLQGDDYQYLRDTEGLIEVMDYYTSTTANSSTPGGVAGYFHSSALRNGDQGDDVPQSDVDYIAHSAGAITVYETADQTAYAADDGTDERVTRSDYPGTAALLRSRLAPPRCRPSLETTVQAMLTR